MAQNSADSDSAREKWKSLWRLNRSGVHMFIRLDIVF